jgi:hypothetical protein
MTIAKRLEETASRHAMSIRIVLSANWKLAEDTRRTAAPSSRCDSNRAICPVKGKKLNHEIS